MTISRIHGVLLAAVASLALAACGGGGGSDRDDTPAGGPDAPPASAGASSEGFLAFIASLADGMFDRSEPYDVSMFDAPASDETAPPIATSIDQ
ncbi:MAG: hypothetical protein H0W40_15395 [Methylibium sp.]|uniref:hypothetical protein n=1 Tax=Methylibium sp. TaxID=2067992 RepID=UPI001831C092|nr:hypothetical protein [Methylibium sp.]MBA3598743.1 hypothetical protein [Methylibium sp.]